MAFPLQPNFRSTLSRLWKTGSDWYSQRVKETQERDLKRQQRLYEQNYGDDSSSDEDAPNIPTPYRVIRDSDTTPTPRAEATNACCPSTTNNYFQSSKLKSMPGMYSRASSSGSRYKRKYRRYKRKYRSCKSGGFRFRRRGYYRPYLARPLRIEKKWWDDYGSFTPLGSGRSTVSVIHLNKINQGAGQNERVGLKVTITDIMLRIWIQGTVTIAGDPPQYANASAPQLVRVMLIWYKQNDMFNRTTGNSLISDILQYPTGAAPMNSPLRLPNASTEFKVLHDKVYNVGGIVTPAYYDSASASFVSDDQVYPVAPNQVGDDVYKKTLLTTSYTGVTGDPTSITYGALYLCALSSLIVDPAAVYDSYFPNVNFQTRLRYTDL